MKSLQWYQGLLDSYVKAETLDLYKIPKTDQNTKLIQAQAHRGYKRFYESLSLAEINELGIRHPLQVKPYEIVQID
jgi:cystathionine beta-lyase family protein involved in aluminum resistance